MSVGSHVGSMQLKEVQDPWKHLAVEDLASRLLCLQSSSSTSWGQA